MRISPFPPQDKDNPYGDEKGEVTAELEGGDYVLPVPPADDDFSYSPTAVEMKLEVERAPEGIVGTITVSEPPKENCPVNITLPDGIVITAVILAGKTEIKVDLPPNDKDNPFGDVNPDDYSAEIPEGNGGYTKPVPPADDDLDFPPTKVELDLEVSGPVEAPTAKITLSAPPSEKGEITLPLPDGTEITVPVVPGQTGYETPLPPRQGDDPYVDSDDNIEIKAELDGGGYALPVDPDTDDMPLLNVPVETAITLTETSEGVQVTIKLEYSPKEPANIEYTVNCETFTAHVEPGQTVIHHPDLIPVPDSPYKTDPVDVKVEVTGFTGGGFSDPRPGAEAEGSYEGNPIPVKMTLDVSDDGTTGTITLEYPPNDDGEITLKLPDGREVTVGLVKGQDTYPDIQLPQPAAGSPYGDSNIDVTAEIEGGGYVLPVQPATDDYSVPSVMPTLTLTVGDVPGDVETGTITLDYEPVKPGTITVTPVAGGEPITIDVVPGQTEYKVDLPHDPASNPYYAGEDVKWQAELTGGGFAADKLISNEDGIHMDGIDTVSAIMLSESDHEVTVSIALGNAPKEDVEITYTINGEEFTGTLKAGERIFTHPETVSVEKGFYEGDHTPVYVHVVGMTDGGLANIVPPKDMSNVYEWFGTPELTFTATDVDGDIEHGVLTLDVAPKSAGTITVTPKDGGEPIVINLVPGRKEYEVDLPHKVVTNPYDDGETFAWDAHVDGGGYHNQPNDADASLELPGIPTGAGVALPDPSAVTPGEPVTVKITLDNPPQDEVTVKYTVNGWGYEKTLQPGESEFEHVVDLHDPDGDGKPDAPDEDGNVEVSVVVTEIIGGGYAQPEAGQHDERDYFFAGPDIDFGENHDVKFSEAWLPDGTQAGEGKISHDDFFTINMNGVAGTLSINGSEISVDGNGNADVSAVAPIKSGGIEITINSIANGRVDYTVKLAGNESHLGEESGMSLHNVLISLSNKVGDAESVSFMVTVADDMPEISLSETALEAVSGNNAEMTGVLAWDYGADDGSGATLRVNGNDVQFVDGKAEITGDYGVLTIDQVSGEYSYKANANAKGTDTFSFSVVDSDNDTASTMLDGNGNEVPATITVNVKPADEPEAAANIQADEAVLNNAIDISVSGFTIISVRDQPEHGKVEETNGKWTYTLTEAIDSGSEQGANVVADGDRFTVTVKDSAGNTFDVELCVDIKDAVPTINVSATAIEAVSGNEAAVTGTLTFDYGADGAGSFKVNGEEVSFVDGKCEIKGAYGVLTIDQASGEYSYKANANSEGEDRFEFSVTDSDGDVVSTMKIGEGDYAAEVPTTIVVNVKPADSPETPSNIQADESALGNAIDISVPGFTIIGVKGQPEHGLVEESNGKWTYTLNEAIASGNIQGADLVKDGDSFTVTVKDSAGNTFDVELGVDIRDDVPTATVKAGTTDIASGHETVVTFTHDFGADGAGSIVINGKEYVPGDRDFKVDGDFGTLHVNDAGELVYTANANATGADTFRFTVTDSDGDIAQTGMDADGNPTGGIPEITFNVAKPDGPAALHNISVTEGGTVDAAVVLPDGYTPVEVKSAPSYGDYKDGVYTLTKTFAHTEQGSDTTGNADSFVLVVQDANGNTYELVQNIDIVDDAPVSENLSENINEGAADPITGNVGGNAGADGLDRVDWTGAEQGVIQGKYGTLTVSEDGSWSYGLDNANPAVMGLSTGEKLEDEIFNFKVYDKDGDHADSTLSITINGESHGITITPETPDPEVPADPDKPVDRDDATTQGTSVSVNEANLPGGGSSDADALTRTGKLAIEAADGIKSITLGGTEIDLNGGLTDIPVENGILKVSYIDGELSYTFTLDKNAPHTEQGRDTLSQNLKLEVENLEGEKKESTLRINITDDIPTAEDVSVEIGKGADDALTGSVIGSVTPGADGFKDSGNPVQWGTDAAKYGEFVHHEDGSWEYRVDNASEAVMGLKTGETLTETFTYKVMDADGDMAEAELTVTIKGKTNDVKITPSNPAKPDPETGNSATAQVFEKNLAEGSEPDATALKQTGSFAVESADGVKSISFGGQDIPLDGKEISIETADGMLTVRYARTSETSGVLNYTYELTNANSGHSEDGADSLSHDFALSVSSFAGKTETGSLNVNVVDDVPEAVLKADSESVKAGETATGEITWNFGADNGEGAKVTVIVNGYERDFVAGQEIRGEYGVLTIDADGRYSYKANAVEPGKESSFGKDTFSFRVRDADGDIASNGTKVDAEGNPVVDENGEPMPDYPEFTVTVTEPEAPVLANQLVNEPDLENGTKLSIDGYEIVGVVEQGAKGKVVAGEGGWKYVLQEALEHNEQGRDILLEADTVKLQVRDELGNIFEVEQKIDVRDDIPEIASEDSTGLCGSFELKSGADKLASLTVNGDAGKIQEDGSLTFETGTGKLVIKDTGSGNYDWTFETAVDAVTGVATEKFEVVATDGDGDTANLTLTVNNDDVPQISMGDAIIVRESGLENGTSPNGEHVSGTSFFKFDTKGMEGVLTINGVEFALDAGGNSNDSKSFEFGNMTFEITSIRDGVVSYSYRLNGAENNADDSDSLTKNMDVTLTTRAGHVSSTLETVIIDDIPTADISGSGQVVAGQEITGTYDYAFGADDGDGKSQAVIINGERHEITAGVENMVEGKFGILTMTPDGKWSYQAKEDIAGQDSFVFEVIDSDGDKALAGGQFPAIDVEVLCKPDLLFDGHDIRVFESGLPTGSQAGLKPVSGTGSFRVDTKGVEGVLTIGDTEIALDADGNGSIAGLSEFRSGNMTLKITGIMDGVVNYTYSLSGAEDHPGSAQGVEDVILREIGISVSTKGGTDSSHLNMVIVDDAPELLPAEQASPKIWIHAVDSDGDKTEKMMWLGNDASKNHDDSLPPGLNQPSSAVYGYGNWAYLSENALENGSYPESTANKITAKFLIDYDGYGTASGWKSYVYLADGSSYTFTHPAGRPGTNGVLLNLGDRVYQTENIKITYHNIGVFDSKVSGIELNYYLSATIEILKPFENSSDFTDFKFFNATTDHGGWGKFYATGTARIYDDAPHITMENDTAHVSIGADNGDSALIEVSADQEGSMKYVWITPDGNTTDLRGMNVGDKWSSYDGSISVTLTEKGYQFDYHETSSEDMPAQTFEIGVNASGAQSGDILTSIRQGADRSGYKVEWDIHYSEYGVFTADETGKFIFTPNEDVRNEIKAGVSRTEKFSFIYTDGDGDKLTGEVAIKIAGTGIDDSDSNIAIKDNGEAGLEVVVTLGTPPAEDAIITYEINGEVFTHTVRAGETGFTHEMARPKSAYELTDIKAEITAIEGGWEHALPGAVAQGWFVSDPAPIGIGLEMVDGDDAKAIVTVEYPPKSFGTIIMELDDSTSYEINLVPGLGEYAVRLDHENLGTPYGTVNTAVFTVKGGSYSPQEVVEIDFDSFTLGTGADIVFNQDSDVVTATVTLDYVPREACEVSYEFAGETYTVNLEAGQKSFTHEYLVQKGDAQHLELTIMDIRGGGYAKPERGDSAAGDFQIFAPVLDFTGDNAIVIEESSMPDGTDPQAKATGSFGINMNNVAGTLTIAGQEIAVDRYGNADVSGLETIDTGRVLITVDSIENGVVNYTYELKEAQDHSENNKISDKIEVKLETRAGESVVDVDVSIVDDAPQYNPTLAPQQIFIHATDSDGDRFTKSMHIGQDAILQEDLTLNFSGTAASGNFVISEETGKGTGYIDVDMVGTNVSSDAKIQIIIGGVTYSTFRLPNIYTAVPQPNIQFNYGYISGNLDSISRIATYSNRQVLRFSFDFELNNDFIDHLNGNEAQIVYNNLVCVSWRTPGWGPYPQYASVKIIDDVPEILIKDDLADVSIGADKGASAKIEVSRDEDNNNKYIWHTSNGEQTDLRNMSHGETWISTDGSSMVTFTDDGYKFNLVQANEHGIQTFDIDASQLVFAADINCVINLGADRDGAVLEWENTITEFGEFVVNDDGTWLFLADHEKVALLAKDSIASQDLTYTYTDGDGDTISGIIRVNIIGQNESDDAIYPAEPDTIVASTYEIIDEKQDKEPVNTETSENLADFSEEIAGLLDEELDSLDLLEGISVKANLDNEEMSSSVKRRAVNVFLFDGDDELGGYQLSESSAKDGKTENYSITNYVSTDPDMTDKTADGGLTAQTVDEQVDSTEIPDCGDISSGSDDYATTSAMNEVTLAI